jgi:hypothetical protein
LGAGPFSWGGQGRSPIIFFKWPNIQNPRCNPAGCICLCKQWVIFTAWRRFINYLLLSYRDEQCGLDQKTNHDILRRNTRHKPLGKYGSSYCLMPKTPTTSVNQQWDIHQWWYHLLNSQCTIIKMVALPWNHSGVARCDPLLMYAFKWIVIGRLSRDSRVYFAVCTST